MEMRFPASLICNKRSLWHEEKLQNAMDNFPLFLKKISVQLIQSYKSW